MSENRSRGIVGIFILIGVLFFIFLIFAFYTISNLKSSTQLDDGKDSKDKPIAVVEVAGTIMQAKPTIEKLLRAEKDKKIKAIIVRVNSPGGAVGPTQEIYEEIRRIDKDSKPVYASFGAVAASGGYYIGAACRKIFTNSGALTGSIGVIMNFMDLSKAYEWAKVRPDIIKAGKYKDIGSAARPMTDEERLLMNEMIENVHEQFIMDIYKVREKKLKGGLNGLREYAQGQIFSGQGAMERGLVDGIAGLWEAGRQVHKELNIEEKFGFKFIKLKKKLSFMEIVEGIEETVQDFRYGVMNNRIPLLIYNP